MVIFVRPSRSSRRKCTTLYFIPSQLKADKAEQNKLKRAFLRLSTQIFLVLTDTDDLSSSLNFGVLWDMCCIGQKNHILNAF